MAKAISGGLVHDLPKDLEQALLKNKKSLDAWEDISAIARNEWICWTISPKQEKTRADHVRRVVSELAEGIRRPCCWVGCIHRTDKAMSPSQKFIANKSKLN